MTNFQNEVAEHPILGFLFSVFFYVVGICSSILLYELPLIVMQLFQLVAWSVAIFVGCITIFEWIKKHKWFKK